MAKKAKARKPRAREDLPPIQLPGKVGSIVNVPDHKGVMMRHRIASYMEVPDCQTPSGPVAGLSPVGKWQERIDYDRLQETMYDIMHPVLPPPTWSVRKPKLYLWLCDCWLTRQIIRVGRKLRHPFKR